MRRTSTYTVEDRIRLASRLANPETLTPASATGGEVLREAEMDDETSNGKGWTRELLIQLIDNIREYGIFAADAEGRIVSWNAGAEKMFGYTSDEAIGMHSDLLFTKEDRLAGVPESERRTAREEGFADDERLHLRKDGNLFFASGIQTALLDKNGGISGFAKIARDLTDRVDLEKRLDAATESLEVKVVERTDQLERSNRSLRREVSERKRAEELRVAVIRKIVATQESERRRIAREIHDSIGQQMTALRLRLNTFADRANGTSESAEPIAELQAMANRIDDEIDFLAWELRPSVLDDLGLPVAAGTFVRDWSAHFGVEADFRAVGMHDERLLPEVEINLYRIMQEALNNTAKHANATRASALLEKGQASVRLIVEDDGDGFDFDAGSLNKASYRGLGLLGIKERAELLGGSLEIESRRGAGTTVFVRVPVSYDGNAGETGEEESKAV